MRIVQVTEESYKELYDELVVALMRLRDEGAAEYVTVEEVKAALLMEGVVDTRLTYKDLWDVLQFKNGLDTAALFTEEPSLLYDPKSLITLAAATKSGLYREHKAMTVDLAQFIKTCKIPSREKKDALRFVLREFTEKPIFATDNAALVYLFVIAFGLVVGEIPVLTDGEQLDALGVWVNGL